MYVVHDYHVSEQCYQIAEKRQSLACAYSVNVR